MFDRSSEKFEYVDCKQLDFFNEAETYCDAAAPEPGKNAPVAANPRKAKRTKAELTEGLGHKKALCELPENEQICAKCGTKMTRIGEKYVHSELILFLPKSPLSIIMWQHTNALTVKKIPARAISNKQKHRYLL